eukprot:3338251-Amphidinium_carterae.1
MAQAYGAQIPPINTLPTRRLPWIERRAKQHVHHDGGWKAMVSRSGWVSIWRVVSLGCLVAASELLDCHI